jgi:hypothetical protein
MKISSVEEISDRMVELILDAGYSEVDVTDICFEASQILGMKKKQ